MLSRLPAITRALLIANIVIFLLQHVPGLVPRTLELWPWAPDWAGRPDIEPFMPWQLISHAFLHGDLLHLVFNMLALVMFGAPLEHRWGERRFAVFYAVSMLGGGLSQLALTSVMAANGVPPVPTVGASGAIFGLLLAYALSFPNHRIGLLFLPVMLKARTFMALLIALQVVLAIFASGSGIAYLAHLGGALAGWLLLLWWRRPRSGPPRGGRRERPDHLKLVR